MLWWQVSEFIRSLPGCEEHGKVFKDEVGEFYFKKTETTKLGRNMYKLVG